MPELSKLQRELISRGTLVLLALLLFYGGYRSMRSGYVSQAEFDAKYPEFADREERGTSGALIMYIIGGLLFLGGGFLAFMAFASPARLASAMGPPDTSRRDWDDD
jgi:hypothetical protein